MSIFRAAIAPLLAGAVTLGSLSAWTMSGRAGRPADVRVSDAWVMAPMAPQTSAFFTLTNGGDASDVLFEVRSPASAATMIGRQAAHDGSGSMVMVDTLTVPAHGTVRMTPFTTDVMIQQTHPLTAGERVPFTLVFRRSGTVRVTAVVVPPGGHP
ncbi:copper chaperone PCu(A)C [Actinomadura nitritigenes]|uniref:copper chaperone PCu(A)C n=1 Tax=Actinomadura nitritigenes TaxID=134602 RepID=UPI003D8FA92B